MELIFLGTGAAEGVPAAYCRCAACQGVRQRGGIEIKTRSSLRVGPHHQIDIAPDHYGQMIRAGTDMYDVEHVLVTHSHEDHFDFFGLVDKGMSSEVNGKPICTYLSESAKNWMETTLKALALPAGDMKSLNANITFIGLRHFQEYTIGGLGVRTVKGNHTAYGKDEYSINYLITLPDGKKMLYACDTGFYKEESWEYLVGTRVDTLILECTFAGRMDREPFPSGHLDLPSYLATLERMTRIGFIDERTEVYATHFNPHQGLDHHEIDRRLRRSPYRAMAAWDGLRVNV